MTYDNKPDSIKIMGEKIPLSYIKLEAELNERQKLKLRNKEIPILTREQFLDIANNIKCTKDAFDNEDIEVATNFLHNIGTILHYDDPNQDLKDLYFISPSWLCRLMAKIITIKTVHNFFKKGVLDIGKIKFIIGERNEEFPQKFYDKYMRLLYRFQIACRIDENRILVPSKLPEQKPENIDETRDIRILLKRYHFFTCIPYGFWSRFMSRMLLLMKEMLCPNSPKVYYEDKEEYNVIDESSNQGGTISTSSMQDNNISVQDNISQSSVTVQDEEEEPTTPTINATSEPGVVYVNVMSKPDLDRYISRNDLIQVHSTNNSSHCSSTSAESLPVSSITDRFNMCESSSSPSVTNECNSTVSTFNSSFESADYSTSTHEEMSCGISTDDQATDLSSEQQCSKKDLHYQSMMNDGKCFSTTSINTVVPLDKEQAKNVDVDKSKLSAVEKGIQKQMDSNVEYPVDQFQDDGKDLILNAVEKSRNTGMKTNIFENQSQSEQHEADNINNESTLEQHKIEIKVRNQYVENGVDICEARFQTSGTTEKLEHATGKASNDTVYNKGTYSETDDVLKQNADSQDQVSIGHTFQTDENNTRNDITISSEQKDASASFIDQNSENKEDIRNNITISSENMDNHFEFPDTNDEDLFTDIIDIAYLLDKNYLTCWKDGVVFNHPQLYFSVQQVPSMKESRQAIETRVSKSPLGFRVLGFIIDHINTLVKEWYKGLSGDDGESPNVIQCVACPVCTRMGINPPHLFDIQTAFHRVYNSDSCDTSIPCTRSHCPQVVNVEDLCPELVFKDLPKGLQLNKALLKYEEQEDQLLGKGGYGTVYRGKYGNLNAAVKLYQFDDSKLTNAVDAFHDVRQEVFILSKLRNHPHIVEFLGFSMQPRLCAVMELAIYGTLHTALTKSETKIKRIVLFRIAQQVASGLKFMHERNIIHRDIKSDNILLFSLEPDAPVNVKLTDFGTANFMSPSGMNFTVGTPGFMAPEVLDYSSSDEYSSKVDIYSFAMVLCEMITLRKPFHDLQSRNQITDAVKKGERPMYCDVLQSFCGLLALTDLMIKLWHQEGMRRPPASKVLEQLKDVAFQLLYGKRALKVPQNPRFMCYVPSVKEVWVVCDDRNGAYIVIIDIMTSCIKDVLTIDGSRYGLKDFNLMHICLIDDTQIAVVLRGSQDVMLTFSVDKQRKILNCFPFEEEHVRSLVASENYVFIGYQNGSFLRVPKKSFLKRKLYKDSTTVVINDKRPTSAMMVGCNELIISNDKYLYQYSVDFISDRSVHMDKPHMEQPIREIITSVNQEIFFVSFQSSPFIYVYDTVNMTRLCEYSCKNIVKDILPSADKNDMRVTCMCSVLDVLWVGTGSGHIFILEFNNNTLTLLVHFQPYALEMRKLCLVELNSKEQEDVKYLMLSSGKSLNDHLFGVQSICSLQGDFPLDVAYLTRGPGREQFSPHGIAMNDEHDCKGKVILMWQVLDAKGIRNLVSPNN